MPYITLPDGTLEFVEDQKEADTRWAEAWDQKPPEPEPAPAAPQQQQQPEQPEAEVDEEDLEFNLKAATELQELARVGADGFRKLINDPIAGVQLLGALSPAPGAKSGGMMYGGGGQMAPGLSEEELKQSIDDAAVAYEALIKTGKDPEGFSYGIRPDVPILGPLFSEDSEFVKENIKPKTWFGNLGSSIVAALSFEKGVSSLLKLPSAVGGLISVAQAFKNEGFKQGVKSTARYLTTRALPEVAQDAMFFSPETPEAIQIETDKIADLETPEERLAMMQTLLAENDFDFDYGVESLKNLGWGLGAVAGFDTALETIKLTNKVIRKTQAENKPFDEAFEEVYQTESPRLQEIAGGEAEKAATLERNSELGRIYTDMTRRIEDSVKNISYSARVGGENFVTRRLEYGDELRDATKAVDEFPDISGDVDAVSKRIETLQAEAGVKNLDQLQQKMIMLDKRIAGYEAAIRKDPDWIKKSTGTGKAKSKNRSKYNKATQAFDRLAELDQQYVRMSEFEEALTAREAAFARLGKVASEADDASVGFRNSLNDARTLVDSINKLDEERIALLRGRNQQLIRQNRLDEVNTDYKFGGAYGEAYGELQDILNAAEAAVATDNLNDEFMRTFVERMDQIHNKIIENGGQAPVVPEFPRGTAMDDVIAEAEEGVKMTGPEALPEDAAGAMPTTAASIENKVPVTKQPDGTIAIDKDKIIAREELKSVDPKPPSVAPKQVIDKTNKVLDRMQDPSATKEALDEYLENFKRVQEEDARLIEAGRIEDALNQTRLNNTNSIKYATSWDNASTLSAVFKKGMEKADLPAQTALAAEKLFGLAGPNQQLARVAEYVEAGDYGKQVQEGLNFIMTTTALLDESARQALVHARDLRRILNGTEVEGLDKVTALSNFAASYEELQTGMVAVTRLMDGFGNGLRLFDNRNRLDPRMFEDLTAGELTDNFVSQINKLGGADGFAAKLSKNAKKAKLDMDATVGSFLKKVKEGTPVTDEEVEGIQNLVEKVYESRGNLKKLQDLGITQDAILANIQINSALSNPALLPTIPVDAVVNGAGELLSKALVGGVNGAFERYVRQAPEAADVYIKEAKIASDTLMQLRHVIGEATEATYYRFVTGRSITDASQAANKAYDIRRQGGLRREEAVMQDLAAEELRIPFMDYVIKRSEMNPEIFDSINKARVLTKVFHDYMIPGEAWRKRGLLGKTLGATTTAVTKYTPLGKKSYYPGGENVNMTAFSQLTASADEFSTALFANANVRARVRNEVDQLIGTGDIPMSDRAIEINKRLQKSNEDLYKPVKAGFDQKIIGYSVNEERILEMTRAINLTEELTGPIEGTVEEVVNAFRRHKDPRIASIGRHIFPFLVSPVNGIKRAVRYAYGGEIYQFGADVARAGASTIAKRFVRRMDDNSGGAFSRNIIEFESKYFSSDPQTRMKAQGALALATGVQAMAWFAINDGNQDIAGGLENSYREARGARDPYTWRIGGYDIPYRFIPLLGQALAFQANLRDIDQFGQDGTEDLLGLILATTANTIMEVPALAGFETVFKTLEDMQDGNLRRLTRLVSGGISRAGDPFENLRKVVIQGFDPRKPADPSSRFVPFSKRFVKEGESAEEGVLEFFPNIAMRMLGSALEYNPTGFAAESLADLFTENVLGEESLGFREKSRRYLWYAPPGETVNANHAGVWYPVQAVLGRYWAFPNSIDDKVKTEMVNNLVSPPRPDLFKKFGIKYVDNTVLNNFNGFLQNEFIYYDSTLKKTYTGANAFLKDLINHPTYKNLPSLDSPYRMTRTFPLQVPILQKSVESNWDRTNNVRRAYLQREVRKMMEEAKRQFLRGDLPGQQFKASDALRTAAFTQGN